MREEFDEEVRARRPAEEEDADDALVGPRIQQSLETLTEGYSWVTHLKTLHPGYALETRDTIPWTAFQTTLEEARVALVTTAGVYLKGQKPFSTSPGELTDELIRYRFKEQGDPSFRVIPASTEPGEILVAHPYLDVSGAMEDINCVFPLYRLRELEDENFVGSLAPRHFSFMGYLPDYAEVVSYAERVAGQLAEDHVDLVVMSGGEALSHQTLAIVQNILEGGGITTISVSLCRDLTEHVGVPRGVSYLFPFGFTFGDANDEATQLRILKDTLRAVEQIDEPGTVLPLPYVWSEA